MTDRDSIETAIAGFADAYNACDLERLLQYYADDLIKSRNGARAETKAETAQRLNEVFANYRTRLEVVTDEISIHGEVAFARGSFCVTLKPKNGAGETQTINRRYLEIWQKVEGRWLVIRTMDNVE